MLFSTHFIILPLWYDDCWPFLWLLPVKSVLHLGVLALGSCRYHEFLGWTSQLQVRLYYFVFLQSASREASLAPPLPHTAVSWTPSKHLHGLSCMSIRSNEVVLTNSLIRSFLLTVSLRRSRYSWFSFVGCPPQGVVTISRADSSLDVVVSI